VLANEEIYDQNEVINQSQGGVTVRYNVHEFSNKLIYLLENPSLLRSMGKNAHEYILKHRNYRNLTKMLDNKIKGGND